MLPAQFWMGEETASPHPRDQETWAIPGVGSGSRRQVQPASHSIILCSHITLVVKNPPANSGDIRDSDLIPGSGRSPREGNGSPLQYSCLENSTEEPGRPQSMGPQKVRCN